jgi:hypothetical protein
MADALRLRGAVGPTASAARHADVGPVADARGGRACKAHHDKPCGKAEGALPYWQYLERQNRRYGGVKPGEFARPPAADRVELSSAAKHASAGHAGEAIIGPTEDRGGYRLPRLGDVPRDSAGERAGRTDEPNRAVVTREPVYVHPGIRVDEVV